MHHLPGKKWGQYIDDTAEGDLETLLSSKFPLQKPRVPLGIQPAPANLRLKHGKVSGYVAARCDSSEHRVMYEWQLGEIDRPEERDLCLGKETSGKEIVVLAGKRELLLGGTSIRACTSFRATSNSRLSP